MKEKLLEKVKSFFSDLWAALLWGMVLVVVMCGVLWIASRFQIFTNIPTSESIVITFIGILATFVVVSNFSQVANIEHKTDKKIEDVVNHLEAISQRSFNKNDKTSLISSIIQTQEDVKIIKGSGEPQSLKETKEEAKKEMLSELQNNIENFKQASLDEIDMRSFQMLKFANALINSKHKNVLQQLLTDINSLFKVTYVKNGKTKTNNARVLVKEGTVQFVSSTGKTPFANVQKINGERYNPEEVDMALIFIWDALKKTGTYERSNISGEVIEDDQI